MSDAVIDALRLRLWPYGDDGASWAILDGARDAEVYAHATGMKARSLYVGELSPALARAAPYLVPMRPGDVASEALLRRMHGASWGVLLRASCGEEPLRRHLRGLLRVQNALGRSVLYRFYDPRVLRAHMPMYDPAGLARVFGPVERWLVETETADGVWDFRLASGALSAVEARPSRPLPWLGEYLREGR